MWELDGEESWVPKNWCFWTVVLEKTLESPLDCKEIQPVHPRGDQFWVFSGRTDAEAETPILWPPHAKGWLIGKTLMLGGLGAGGEGDDRGWDGWMASPTQWTWVWVNSGSWWWTGRTGMLRLMGSQRVGHDWATELNWTELNWWPATLKKQTNKNQYSGCWPSPFSVPTRGEKRRIQRELFIKQSLTVSLLWWVPCCSGQWGYRTQDETSSLISWSFWCGEDAVCPHPGKRLFSSATLHHVLLRGCHENGEHGGEQARCGPCSLGSWQIKAKRAPVHSTNCYSNAIFQKLR